MMEKYERSDFARPWHYANSFSTEEFPMTMTVPPEFEPFVRQQLTQGGYQSVEDVVGDGLRMLQELKSRQEEFRREVQIGVDQLDRGEGIALDREELRRFFEGLQQRGRDRFEASRSGS
jgi:antitoxin ParD1/3/4